MVKSSFSAYRPIYRPAARFPRQTLAVIGAAHKVESAKQKADAALSALAALA